MNEDELWRRGPMAMDPMLDHLREPATGRCWWCGDVATTEEHRFKASTLRRVAQSPEGRAHPGNVFKKSSDFEGTLLSIKKGSQVRWRKNLCADCNNAKSQPFDRAYDDFEAYLVEHMDEMSRWQWLDWEAVYGTEWEKGARDLARYFGKQIGCMLASQHLPVPQELIGFLDGTDRCPSTLFMLYINERAVDAHEMMRRDGVEDGLSTFVGLLESVAYQTEGKFSGVSYGYHIGYVWMASEWRDGTDRSSWFEYPSIELPRIDGQ